MLLEIGGRCDHRHAHLRPDAHGDHVLRDLFAHPDSGIEAVGNDIGQAIVDDDLDIDVWMVGQEPLQGRLQDGHRRMLAGRELNGPGGFSRNSPNATSCASISSKRGAIVSSRLPRLPSARRCGWCGWQAQPQPFFQAGWSGSEPSVKPQARRRPGEASLLRDGGESGEIVGFRGPID